MSEGHLTVKFRIDVLVVCVEVLDFQLRPPDPKRSRPMTETNAAIADHRLSQPIKMREPLPHSHSSSSRDPDQLAATSRTAPSTGT